MSAKLSISAKRRKRAKSSRNGKGKSRRYRPIPLLSILIGVFAWAVSLQIVNLGRAFKYANLAPGQRAPVTILAEVDFETIDYGATDLLRDTAAEEVLPVFSISDDAVKPGLQTIDKLFDRLSAIYKANPDAAPGEELVKGLNDDIDLLDLQLEATTLISVVPALEVENVRNAIKQSVEVIWAMGIISSVERTSNFQGQARNGRINVVTGPADAPVFREVEVSTLKIPAEATAAIMAAVSSRLDSNLNISQVIPPLVQGWVNSSLMFENDLTSERRRLARDEVIPVLRQIRAGSTLMEAGNMVDERTIDLVQVHQARLSESAQSFDVFIDLVRYSVLLLGMLFVSGCVLQVACPELLRDPPKVVLIGVLSLVSIASAKALLYSASVLDWMAPSLVMYWMPHALAALLATILVGSKFAMPVILYGSFGVALVLDQSIGVFLLGLLSGFTASLSAREIHKRSNVFRAGIFVGIVQLVVALLFGAIYQTPLEVLALQGLVAFFTGPLIALLSLLLIPFFEYTFKMTTDVRLLELSEMGHPLLERMALEAPGTYHHSLMVANLASSAATEVGANDLLVRVCAYYHDIGKMVKPEFFIENIPYKDNPHDDLSPSMSTLVIISHVKEGLSMASRYNLPQPIIDGIEQHHGTSKIAYFYHRAREQAEESAAGDKKNKSSDNVREEDFRYPGPKPQNVEMGILLLADTIEAASRAMDKPSPSNIENLVNEIVNEKMRDGQLDDCGMNFTQLADIRKSFIYNLNNMLHGRIAYPKEKDESRDQQSAETISAGSTQSGDTGSLSHAASTKPGS